MTMSPHCRTHLAMRIGVAQPVNREVVGFFVARLQVSRAEGVCTGPWIEIFGPRSVDYTSTAYPSLWNIQRGSAPCGIPLAWWKCIVSADLVRPGISPHPSAQEVVDRVQAEPLLLPARLAPSTRKTKRNDDIGKSLLKVSLTCQPGT